MRQEKGQVVSQPGHSIRDPCRNASADVSLPPALAFLSPAEIDDAILAATAREARRGGTCAARVLIANGHIDASAYYRALARHLGIPVIDGWPRISTVPDIAKVFRLGLVELAAPSPVRWLMAPSDETLDALISAHRSGRRWTELAITTPAHFASILTVGAQYSVEQAASDALPDATPKLSAKGALDKQATLAAMLTLAGLITGSLLVPRVLSSSIGLLFLAGISFRLVLCAVGLEGLRGPIRRLTDAELPHYTVLVPLSAEADIVPDLLAALDALDYPRSKLEVFILVEPEDIATRAALARETLPPWLRVVTGPIGGHLRTKPRALNIGLLMARGELLTIFDAEDRPHPNQLRLAAAMFDESPADLACLQAHLSIDNGSRCLLARMFALEYATLFDVLNVGISNLNLPMALGGTSSHFKTAAVREVGGWDAWNVTEDADLGLRLARMGFGVGSLPSTTLEAAPEEFGSWMKQRRRWTKGWMQTFIVLLKDARRVAGQLGWTRTIGLALLLTNLVIGPLLFPIFSAYVAFRFARYGVATPSSFFEVAEATLEVIVVLLGVVSTVGGGYLGLRARRLKGSLASLPLLIPYQLMISAAAWMGFWDLIRRPHHWHKTKHKARRSTPTD